MSNTALKKKLKNIIYEKGVPLKEVGINSFGFRRRDALEVIDLLDKLEVPILGGDVYKIDNGKIIPTYDSWPVDDSDLSLSQWSAKKSTNYINSYNEAKDANFLYILVISSDELSIES